ncbi:dephospho-CoA kinase [Dunaliella salina]|uniref:Dephospho-CoA kinase n=1 Tax=Dunaliella salina TaxID=3046 RepID=A0ABQ7FWQ8_DUNSA|nr:dephospho-CoA kinase [Dunaliella salina]|eukprot:KAF5826803.1 dephospho-CoA kinase [Dunaliella salina]
MLLVGLTGGIASGKSTVSKALREEGQAVVDCDAIAHAVTARGRWGFKRIVRAFGADCLTPEGEIDREKLGRLIFNSPVERRKLNAATHLPVGMELLRLVLWHWTKCTRVLYIDMPLLFETGAYKWMARNVVVLVDQDMQVSRLQARDQITTEAALSKVKAQMPVESKAARADHVIDNRGSVEQTKSQVSSLVQKLRSDTSSYLHVLISPPGLCLMAVFLAAIGSEWGGKDGAKPQGMRIV